MRAALLAVLLTAGCAQPAARPEPWSRPEQPPALRLPEPLRAVGTEPFWAATIAGTTLIYLTPDDQRGTRIEVRRQDIAGSAVFSGVLSGKPFRLRIFEARCSDGMSDTIYRYTAELEWGRERRSGCARGG